MAVSTVRDPTQVADRLTGRQRRVLTRCGEERLWQVRATGKIRNYERRGRSFDGPTVPVTVIHVLVDRGLIELGEAVRHLPGVTWLMWRLTGTGGVALDHLGGRTDE